MSEENRSMVTFMVKWALASIPAIIILLLIVSLAWIILVGPDKRTIVGIKMPTTAAQIAEGGYIKSKLASHQLHA